MAKGTVNKVIIVGRLGSDPEVRYTPSGAAVANFNVATNRVYKNREGNQVEETEWHRIVVWSRLAEIAKEYCRKGSRIYIEGRLQTRDWEDQNGQKRYTTEVVAQELQLLDSAGQRSDMGGGGGGGMPAANIAPPESMDTTQDDVPF